MALATCRCKLGHVYTAKCTEEPDVNATIVEQNCPDCEAAGLDGDEFEILDVTYPEYPEEDDDRFLRKILP